MSKYDINNFYLGKLTFVSPIICNKVNLVSSDKIIEKSDAIMNGAINLKPVFMSNENINYEINYYYNSVFTIFYKTKVGYYCLHNGNKYLNCQVNQNDFCDNLVPLKQMLPKIAFDIPNELSFKEALNLFNLIYKKNKYFYKTESFDINNFYVGNVHLCTFVENNSNKVFCNLEKYLRLCKLGLNTHSGYSKTQEISSLELECDFSIFQSVFYKLNDKEYYNINDYSIYQLDNDLDFKYSIEIKDLFKEWLKEKNKNYDKDKINISKVLKIMR